MIATLILVVCLNGACRDERMPVDVTFGQCAVLGQQIAHDWLEEHPKYTLGGWKCQVGHPGGQA